MNEGGRSRVVIESIEPQVDWGRYPIKRVVGNTVTVTADIFADGHDEVAATLLHRHAGDSEWFETRMERLVNDRWTAEFTPTAIGKYLFYDQRVDRSLRHVASMGFDVLSTERSTTFAVFSMRPTGAI